MGKHALMMQPHAAITKSEPGLRLLPGRLMNSMERMWLSKANAASVSARISQTRCDRVAARQPQACRPVRALGTRWPCMHASGSATLQAARLHPAKPKIHTSVKAPAGEWRARLCAERALFPPPL